MYKRQAAKFAAMGVNIVSVPKTIDNDIWGTDISFGFDSAVSIATEDVYKRQVCSRASPSTEFTRTGHGAAAMCTARCGPCRTSTLQ